MKRLALLAALLSLSTVSQAARVTTLPGEGFCAGRVEYQAHTSRGPERIVACLDASAVVLGFFHLGYHSGFRKMWTGREDMALQGYVATHDASGTVFYRFRPGSETPNRVGVLNRDSEWDTFDHIGIQLRFATEVTAAGARRRTAAASAAFLSGFLGARVEDLPR